AEPLTMEALRQAQYRGGYSLLYLLQGLGKRRSSVGRIRLFAVTAHAQLTSEQEQSLSPEWATISGLLAASAAELPWLECRHIDFELVSSVRNAGHLMNELATHAQFTPIAYRHGQRLIV